MCVCAATPLVFRRATGFAGACGRPAVLRDAIGFGAPEEGRCALLAPPCGALLRAEDAPEGRVVCLRVFVAGALSALACGRCPFGFTASATFLAPARVRLDDFRRTFVT